MEHQHDAGRGRDNFAARLATIVLRWRTVYMQQPHPANTVLWMSARAAAKPGASRPG